MKEYTLETIRYYDSIADSYVTGSATIVLKDKINKFINLLLGEKILDVACGPGHDTDHMSKMGLNCTGIDLSEKMIELARKNNEGTFEIMDALDLKFADNLFNGIWCSSIFVHIERNDLPRLLANFIKILKDDGILGVITAQEQGRIKKPSDTRAYIMFNKEELEDYLKQAGFGILFSEIFPYGGKNRIFLIANK